MKQVCLLVLFFGLFSSSSSWASFFHYNRYALDIAPDDKEFSSQSQKEPKKGLVISGALDTEKTTNYFGAFDFVFENKSDEWMIIRDLRISFPSNAQNQFVSIPVGMQFSSWTQGMQNADDYNLKKVAVITSIIGGAAMVASDNKRDQKLGAFTTGVSLLSLSTMKDYNEIYADLPPYHLLRGDIVIPPGLFMKRWLLLNSTKHKETGYIHTMVFDFKDQNGNPKRYYLQFRASSGQTTGGWQTEDFKAEQNKPTDNIIFSQ